MMQCQQQKRTAKRINNIIKAFLNERNLLDNNPGWEVRESDVAQGGFGVFCTKDFDVGEVIFIDSPVVIGPRCLADCPTVCANCFSNKTLLNECKNNCGLNLCGSQCQNSTSHLKECKFIRQSLPENTQITEGFRKILYENLIPIKSLFLHESNREVVRCLIAHDRDSHGHEIDTLKNELGFEFKEEDEKFMKFVCCVMDANAFEVSVGNTESYASVRGLYPLGSLANHSCIPNTLHVFDDRQRMITKAAKFIQKNSEIFHSYTKLTWGTTTRLYHLHKTKHFICKCDRCKDPSEFGTYIGSVLCKLCRGIVSPLNPFKAFARWQCEDCKNIITGKDTGELITLLGSILKNMDPNDFPFMYKFLNGKLKTVVPENNQVAIELKYKIVWILGHKNGYKWSELPTDLLKIKETICQDLLEVLEKLRCGQSKMRGLLLYELFCCKREFINRINKQNSVPEEVHRILYEAASILKYDLTAPQDIKNF